MSTVVSLGSVVDFAVSPSSFLPSDIYSLSAQALFLIFAGLESSEG